MATKPEDLFTHRIELWGGGGGGEDEQNEFRLLPGFRMLPKKKRKALFTLNACVCVCVKFKNGFYANK